jgi:hypothetical protein
MSLARNFKLVRYLPELAMWFLVLQVLTLVHGSGSKYANMPVGGGGRMASPSEDHQDEEPHSHRCARLLINVESTLGIGEKQATSFAHKNIGASTPFPRNPELYPGEGTNPDDYVDVSKTDPDSLKVVNPSLGELKVYRPAVFNSIRRHAGVPDELYIQCLRMENLNCLNSDSKSGQAFWKSADDTVVLKTLKHYEVKNLRRVLDNYAAHTLTDYSSIASVLGLYRVRTRTKLWGTFPLNEYKYFIATKNVYPRNSWHIVGKYDLKGSTVGRRAGPGSTVMKDLNLLESNTKLGLGPARPVVLHALQRDVNFLKRHRLMDYSLLIAVERNPTSHLKRFIGRITKPLSVAPVDAGKITVLGGDGLIYHVGIIDFLQKYSFRKWMETLLKSLFHDPRKISSVDPELYARRCYAFISHVTS